MQGKPRLYSTPHHTANWWVSLGCVWFQYNLYFPLGMCSGVLHTVVDAFHHVRDLLGWIVITLVLGSADVYNPYTM